MQTDSNSIDVDYQGYGMVDQERKCEQDHLKGPFSLRYYKDSAIITGITVIFLLGNSFADLLGTVVGGMERNVLYQIRDGVFADDFLQQEAAGASDLRVGIVGLLQVMITIPCGIIFLFWTYRACKNAHCLSQYPLAIKPGWAVGWYFIPIANLVYPYMALHEAFNASCHPEERRSGRGAGFILGWWWVHVLTNIVANIYFRLGLRLGDEPTIDILLIHNGFSLASDSMGVILNLMTVVVVMRFLSRQRESHGKTYSLMTPIETTRYPVPPPVPPQYQPPMSNEPPSEYQTFGT